MGCEALRMLAVRFEKSPEPEDALLAEAWDVIAPTAWKGEALSQKAGRFAALLDARAFETAALMLVPEGLGISMAQHGKRGDDCSAYVGKSDSDARGNFMTDTFDSEAKTMARAVAGAALKARAGRDKPKRKGATA